MIFEVSLLSAAIVTALGVLYLATIGRLTDAIPVLGLADDVLVVLVMITFWLLVGVSAIVDSYKFWVFGIIVVLCFLEIKKGTISKLVKNWRR